MQLERSGAAELGGLERKKERKRSRNEQWLERQQENACESKSERQREAGHRRNVLFVWASLEAADMPGDKRMEQAGKVWGGRIQIALLTR
eukprot:3799447-Rhodomonas_salina.1